jgi:hypothetical protein
MINRNMKRIKQTVSSLPQKRITIRNNNREVSKRRCAMQLYSSSASTELKSSYAIESRRSDMFLAGTQRLKPLDACLHRHDEFNTDSIILKRASSTRILFHTKTLDTRFRGYDSNFNCIEKYYVQ